MKIPGAISLSEYEIKSAHKERKISQQNPIDAHVYVRTMGKGHFKFLILKKSLEEGLTQENKTSRVNLTLELNMAANPGE